MKTINKTAAKAYIRIANEFERSRDYDYGIDYGEFSGPSFARMEEKALTRVAEQFGMTLDELENNVYLYACQDVRCELKSQH